MALLTHQKALLDTIAGPESAGRYNVVYGGRTFSDFSDHPRISTVIGNGPNAGKTSSAAGKYQFLGSTWDSYQEKLGLPDFSPESQDKAAWALASDVYKQKTGKNLDHVLLTGTDNEIASVGRVLSGTWTSLPGGIEQGTNQNRFVASFHRNLGSEGKRNNAAANNSAKVVDLNGDGVIDQSERDAAGLVETGKNTLDENGNPVLEFKPGQGSGSGAGGSGSVEEAIDRQTDSDALTAGSALEAFTGFAGDFFGRAVLVVLGIVFVAGGVMIFGRGSPLANAIGKVAPVAKKLPVAA